MVAEQADVDRGVAGRAGGAAAAGGPGLLELLATAEHGRAGREGESEGGPACRPASRPSSHRGRGSQPRGEPGRGRARRKQGGQPGHRGSGLAPVATPDHREPVEPACCAGCGGGLAGAPGTVASRVQVFDLPSFSLAVTEYQLMRRLCGCGHATTADLPAGVRGGPTCYGPNVTAAATLLASQDVLGIERTADLMSTLLGVPGVHRVHLLLPDPPGRRADHGRVRTGAQDGAARAGRVGHRRNPRPADRRRQQRAGLPQPARVHRAHDAGLHRRRGGPGLVRRGR